MKYVYNQLMLGVFCTSLSSSSYRICENPCACCSCRSLGVNM